MRALLLALVLLPVACDDPEAAARAASVLEHGVTYAHADCNAGYFNGTVMVPLKYIVSRLQDGACFATLQSSAQRETAFYPRSVAGSVSCEAGFVYLAGGGAIVSGLGPASPIDMSTKCTGFNLEAFGVSP